MQNFVCRELKNYDVKNELTRIGFDKSYINKGSEKFVYKTLKIYSLTVAQANILKQTALSVGADCATSRDVVTGKAEISDCILTGSISQLKKISEKLKFQPFGLKNLAETVLSFTQNQYCNLPKIVGILNLTDNSFSDGGMYNDFESAKEHLLNMISEGANIIDIGAESTKPYSEPVSSKKQIEKLLPIIEFAKDKVKISVDTRSSEVAKECLNTGASMINDVSGMEYDKNMIDVISEYNCPIVIQHSKGTPLNMQDNPHYNDVIEEIYLELYKKCEIAKQNGIENIIIDAGIGFGKSREDNFEIIRRIEEFRGLGYPLMLGVSRKSFLNLEDNFERDIYSTVFNALAIERNVDYIRVHNVKMHKNLIDLMKMFVIQ